MYASTIDIERYVPARVPFTASSKPSATMVDQLLVDANSDIEAALIAGGYALPIDSSATLALAQLKSACARCAAALVEDVAPTGNDKQRDHHVKMCEAAKKMIRDGNLAGLDQGATTGEARSAPSIATEPLFTRDMDL